MVRSLVRASIIVAAAALGGCDRSEPPQGEPLPPPRATPCDGPARRDDPRNVERLPARASRFCLDPNGSDRGYGEQARNPLDGIYDLFDGEAEIYKSFHVLRVVEARYVDGTGGSGTIDVYLSRFASAADAYGLFTKRVVGSADPAGPDAPKSIEARGRVALGMGNAYLWRGSFVAELTYNDDRKSAGQVAAAATELLPPLLAAIADKLPGPDDLPAAAQALPADKRIALGIRMVTGDVLDVSGAGPGAVGYYRDGEQRWRVLAVVRQSSAEAESVLATLGASDSAREKGLGDEGVRLLHGAPGAPRTEWLVARQGARLFGVGDEPLVLREGMTADERGRLTLTAARKRELLGHLLAGIGHIEGGSPRAP